jgi:hypothetical protein
MSRAEEVDARKSAARHITTVPIIAPRKSIADPARIVGWKYQVFDGWGRILRETPRGTLYGSAQEAHRAGRETE